MIFSPLDQAFCTLKYANKYYLKWTTMIMVIVSTYELESVSLSDISKTSSSHACKILSFLHLLECQHHEPHGPPLSPAKVASRKFWKIHISARKSHQPHMHPFHHTKIFGKLNNYWKKRLHRRAKSKEKASSLLAGISSIKIRSVQCSIDFLLKTSLILFQYWLL